MTALDLDQRSEIGSLSDSLRVTMKSYLLKVSGREEGPYGEAQIAQMFADGRVDRNTSCKPADRGDWKSVDDYLPMLKYGTQLPLPTQDRSMATKPPPIPS